MNRPVDECRFVVALVTAIFWGSTSLASGRNEIATVSSELSDDIATLGGGKSTQIADVQVNCDNIKILEKYGENKEFTEVVSYPTARSSFTTDESTWPNHPNYGSLGRFFFLNCDGNVACAQVTSPTRPDFTHREMEHLFLYNDETLIKRILAHDEILKKLCFGSEG